MPLFRRKKEEGLDPERTPAGVAAQPSESGPWGWTFATGFRLTVEDVFTIAGRGTVVTGRIESGSIKMGATVRQTRTDGTSRDVTVDGIEMFRKTLDTANAGDNVGLLLREVGQGEIGCGDVLTT